MSNSLLIQRSKRAAIVAGVLWPVAFSILLVTLGVTGAFEDQSPPKETIDIATLGIALVFYVPFTIMMLSTAGVSSRYADQWRVLGRLGCALALSGLAVVPLAYAAYLGGTPQGFEPSAMGELAALGIIVGTIVLGVGFRSVRIGRAAVTDTITTVWHHPHRDWFVPTADHTSPRPEGFGVQPRLGHAGLGSPSTRSIADVYPELPAGSKYKATVVVIDRVIDAASGTFSLFLDLPNPDHTIPGGLRCRVRFHDEVAPSKTAADATASDTESSDAAGDRDHDNDVARLDAAPKAN